MTAREHPEPAVEWPPRTPDGRIDWLILEGHAIAALLVAAIIWIVIDALVP